MVKIVCELLEKELESLEHIDLWREREEYQLIVGQSSITIVQVQR